MRGSTWDVAETHLFNDVGAELLHRQDADVADELTDQRLAESDIVQVEDVLNDIVAEGVLDQGQRVEGDLGDELHPLRVGSVVDTSLENATSVSVRSDLDAVSGDGVVDELVVLGDQSVQTLLNDVVPVQVLDQSDDVQAEGEDDAPDLVGLPGVAQEIDHLLDGPGTVHVQRDADEVVGDRFANDVALFLGRVLQELLTEVIAEGVYNYDAKSVIVCGPALRPDSPVMSSGKCP